MGALRLAWLSYVRRGWGLLLILLPVSVLFVLVSLLVSLESVLDAQKNPGVDERMFRLWVESGPPITRQQLDKIEKMPGVSGVSPKITLKCKSNDGIDIECSGIGACFIPFSDKTMHVSKEALDKWMGQKNAAIVGKNLADKFGFQEGKPLGIQIDGKPNTDFVVTSISTEGSKLDDIWLHSEAADQLRGAKAGRYGAMWIQASDAGKRAEVIESARKMLEETSSVINTLPAEAAKAQMLNASNLLIMLLRAAGLLSIIIVAFTVLSVLTLSIDARRRELATLRAIGYKRGSILRMVVTESVLLVIPGAVLGGAGAYALFGAKPLKITLLFSLHLTMLHIGIAVALGGLLAALLGTLPGVRAAAVNVLSTLRGG